MGQAAEGADGAEYLSFYRHVACAAVLIAGDEQPLAIAVKLFIGLNRCVDACLLWQDANVATQYIGAWVALEPSQDCGHPAWIGDAIGV